MIHNWFHMVPGRNYKIEVTKIYRVYITIRCLKWQFSQIHVLNKENSRSCQKSHLHGHFWPNSCFSGKHRFPLSRKKPFYPQADASSVAQIITWYCQATTDGQDIWHCMLSLCHIWLTQHGLVVRSWFKLVQVMNWRLFNTKPSPEPVVIIENCRTKKSVIRGNSNKNLGCLLTKMYWKMSSAIWQPCCSGRSMLTWRDCYHQYVMY